MIVVGGPSVGHVGFGIGIGYPRHATAAITITMMWWFASGGVFVAGITGIITHCITRTSSSCLRSAIAIKIAIAIAAGSRTARTIFEGTARHGLIG